MKAYYDIVIVGAGAVGLAFAASLRGTNLNILLIEKSAAASLKKPKDDGREIALTHASVAILKELGVWDKFKDEDILPIKCAKVFNEHNRTPLTFLADKSKLEALGYLVANYRIRTALFEVIREYSQIEIVSWVNIDQIQYSNGQYSIHLSNKKMTTCRLLIGADGRHSYIRKMMAISTKMDDFSKTMIVCRMKHQQPHYQTAYEYFYQKNTLALLPLKNSTSSVIITLKTTEAEAVMSLPKDEFNHFVNREFEHNLGQMDLISERFSYPLLGLIADKFIAPACALIGDATVAMHPVTAHGFNLGLRGQAILAKEIKRAHRLGTDIAADFVLKKYQTQQMAISCLLYYGTNSVVSLFANDEPKLKPIRQLVLKFAKNFPPIHYIITQHLTQASNKLWCIPGFK